MQFSERGVPRVEEAPPLEVVTASTFGLSDDRINAESTAPECRVSTADKEDANAVSVINATSYVDETDQMRPYDEHSDVATTQDARERHTYIHTHSRRPATRPIPIAKVKTLTRPLTF